MEYQIKNDTKHSDDIKNHTDIKIYLVVLVAIGYIYSSYSFTSVELSAKFMVSILVWLSLIAFGLLLLILALFPSLFSGILDKLFGGDGEQNDFNPKNIFDHVRNYFITAPILSSGLLLYPSNTTTVFIFGSTLFTLGLVFMLLNFMHGKRAISNFLDKEVSSSELRGYQLKIWNTGIVKAPVYLLLPVLALAGVFSAYLHYFKNIVV